MSSVPGTLGPLVDGKDQTSKTRGQIPLIQKMKDARFSKLVLFINALVPLGMLLWDVYHKRVGANPLEFVTRTTGMLTLVFLMLTLAITPVRHTTRLNW